MAASNDPSTVDRLLAHLARSMADHVLLLTDLTGRILWINTAAERTLRWNREEAIGQSIERTFTQRDRDAGVPEQERRIALTGGFADNDRWHLRADGAPFWSSGALYAIRDDRGETIAFGKMFRDRTDWKEQQDLLTNELEVRKMEAEQHVASLGTLAHEVRSPLAALVNATALLRQMTAAQPQLDVPVSILERQLTIIRRQVDDLVDVTRMNTGKMRLAVSQVTLQEVIEQAAATLLANDAHPERVRLVLPPERVTVQGDSMRLQQIVSNLLSNALKFTPDDGEIVLSLAVVDSDTVLRVKDTGIGISYEMLPKIFDLFTQARTETPERGLGIGLALVRELVTLHGGSIQVRSDGPGQGSEFIVRLPLAGIETRPTDK